MRRRFGRTSFVDSCGVRPGGEVDPLAVAVMDELGVDLTGHRPKGLRDLEDTNFDLIVTLSPEAHHLAMDMSRTLAADVEYWPCLDPTALEGSREQRLSEYRSVRDGLDARIAARFLRPAGARTIDAPILARHSPRP